MSSNALGGAFFGSEPDEAFAVEEDFARSDGVFRVSGDGEREGRLARSVLTEKVANGSGRHFGRYAVQDVLSFRANGEVFDFEHGK